MALIDVFEDIFSPEPEAGTEDLEASSLEPELMEVPGMGEVLVGGDPFGIAEDLDAHQGDNIFNFQGDCGLLSVMNICRMMGIDITEDQIVAQAIGSNLCVFSSDLDAGSNGGTSVFHRKELLAQLGIGSEAYEGSSVPPEVLGQMAADGYGVNISINAGYAWNDANYIGDGSTNHSIVVTGAAWDKDTGEFLGLFVCDSGQGEPNTGATFLSKEVLEDCYTNAPGSSALITNEPVRC